MRQKRLNRVPLGFLTQGPLLPRLPTDHPKDFQFEEDRLPHLKLKEITEVQADDSSELHKAWSEIAYLTVIQELKGRDTFPIDKPASKPK